MLYADLIPIIDVLYQRTYVPIAILDDHKNLCYPKFTPFEKEWEHFQYLFEEDEYPLHIVNTYLFFGASFQCMIEGKHYYIFIGPCPLLGSHQIDLYSFDILSHLSSESLESFQEYSRTIYTLFTNQSLHNQKIPIQYNRIHKQKDDSKASFEENLYLRRSQAETRDSYQFELRFLDYVKRGRKDKIDWIFKKIDKTYIVQLADDALEATKLKFAAVVAVMTRLAITCGVPLDSAFSLSDSLIQGLQKIHIAAECINYIKYASYEFCDLIQGTAQTCSTLINQVLRYIDTHLYEKISLQDLADETGHSTVYISTRFKKELQKTLTDYILERKIDEAKHLLLFTDYSFQEISTLLNFTSQSHFTQRFRQITQQTPKAFRETNFQYL